MKTFARWGHRASNGARNSLQITWRRRALTPCSHTVRIFSQLPVLSGREIGNKSGCGHGQR